MNLYYLKNEIIETTQLAALAILQLQNPAFDEVTKSEAYEIAGSRRWLDFQIKKGNIKGRRRGKAPNSPIFFSRLDIAALKRAEKTVHQIIKI